MLSPPFVMVVVVDSCTLYCRLICLSVVVRLLVRGLTGGGVVANNLVPLESFDPRTVSSADKWDPVTPDGFCDPRPDGTMAYSGHCVCRNDSAVGGAVCWGNFGRNQQNGGRIFATQATVFKAGPCVEL